MLGVEMDRVLQTWQACNQLCLCCPPHNPHRTLSQGPLVVEHVLWFLVSPPHPG